MNLHDSKLIRSDSSIVINCDACSAGLFHPQRICILGASLSRWQWEDLPTKRQRPPPSVANRRRILAATLSFKNLQDKFRFKKAKAIKNISRIHESTVSECWQYHAIFCNIAFRRQPSGFSNCFHTLHGMSNVSLVHDAHTLHS